jgi:hypothetical protein
MDTSHVAGATSKIVSLRAYLASSGMPATAVVFNTSGISATYTRDGSTPTTITLATMTQGTWATSGFVHRGKGIYEVGLPNAALVAGADGVEIAIDGVTDTVFVPTRVEIMGTDPRSSAAPDVNVTKVAGTTQTARDLGASVLISSGTGTGQLDVTSGVIKANLAQILGTALTETAGQLAAGFKKFFNIASPASTMDALTLVATATNLTNAGPDTAGTGTLLTRLSAGRATNLDNLDAAVSTRSTYAGADTAGTTTLLSRLSAGRATNLDNLDAAVSTRSTYAGADSAGTTTLLSRLSAGRATNLDNLDASVNGVPAAVLAAAAAAPIASDAKKMNGTTILGAGTSGNLWRG